MATKKGIFEELLVSWLSAKGDKKKRGEIVRNLCTVAGVHPKMRAAIVSAIADARSRECGETRAIGVLHAGCVRRIEDDLGRGG